MLRQTIETTAAWAYTTPAAEWVRGSVWAVPSLSVAHLFGLVLLLGSQFMCALRGLGLAWRRDDAGVLMRRVAPATLGGLAVMVVSGSLLFAAGADRYVASGPFELKMGAFAVAMLAQGCAYTVALRNAASHRVRSTWTAIGGVTFLLWLCVAVAGRFIAFY